MNILHLNRFFYSGQTTHVFSLLKEQQRLGHLAHLAIEGYPTLKALDVYKQTIEDLGVTVIRPGDEKTLTRLVKQFKFDLIHAHSSLTFAMAEKLSHKFQIPFVITCHGLGLNRDEYRLFLEEASLLFCISERVAKSMHEYADKVHVISNGVDLEVFKPAPKSSPVKVALVSRIDAVKQEGYFHLCKAVDLLDDLEFYVASNKPPASSKAKYLGWSDNISGLLSKTDIVVGTGRAIIEGLATGNAGLILGKTYQGLLTAEQMERQKYFDLSGLSGRDPCYKDIFFDLANLTQDPSYLQKVQVTGRKLAEEHYDITAICTFIVDTSASVLK